MKFKLLYKQKGSEKISDDEEYTKDLDTEDEVKQWCIDTLDYFNSTLRPGEKKRTFVGFKILSDEKPPKEHEWSKINLVTISDKTGLYDKLRCDVCGITARRYGLDTIEPDKKYRSPKYQYCKEGKEVPKKRKDKKKDEVKRKVVPKPKGLRVMLSVKDIVKHKKDDKMTMPTFGQLKHQDERLSTINTNFNNMTPKTLEIIQGLLGTKLEMETPLVMEIYVPEGALLDHYKETIQTKLDEDETEEPKGDEGQF